MCAALPPRCGVGELHRWMRQFGHDGRLFKSASDPVEFADPQPPRSPRFRAGSYCEPMLAESTAVGHRGRSLHPPVGYPAVRDRCRREPTRG